MIHLGLTAADARRVSDGELEALVTVGERIRRIVGFDDRMPVPDPPAITIFREGEFSVEYYHPPLVARLNAAIDAALRWKDPVVHDMSTHSRHVMHSSKDSDWGTPPEMFDALDGLFKFGIDVAANAENRLCETWCGPDHDDPARKDGLTADWLQAVADDHAYDVAFMNPSWSREQKQPIEPWIEAAYRWSRRGMTVVGVLPAAVQTRWWQAFARKADAIWFIPHRVSFVAPPGRTSSSAGVNTAIVIWRPSPAFIGHSEPAYRYWTYRTAAAKARTA